MDQVTDDALITTFGRLVESETRLSRQLGRSLEAEAGVSHAEFEVLLRISRADQRRLSMGALAEQVVLTSGGITRLVDRMTDAGLLERVPCETDRRMSFAALTTTGQRTLRRAKALHARNLRQVFDGFSATDLRRFDALLERVRGAELGG